MGEKEKEKKKREKYWSWSENWKERREKQEKCYYKREGSKGKKKGNSGENFKG